MPRNAAFTSPYLIGFDRLEEALDRLARGATDGYPPYNIEDVGGDRLAITLAVAGFALDELDVVVEGDRLLVRGRRADNDDVPRQFLHRGIATRPFQRAFLLADGIDVIGARLADGLLTIDLARPETIETTRSIPIMPPAGEPGTGEPGTDGKRPKLRTARRA
ncbi:MAG: Hsp20 family protein [Alphaproteobacteria bacterium]